MSSGRRLREFISARLTAAAEEIFAEFEKTIVQYEEEIDRQRRLLDITWKPRITVTRTELPKHYICVEEEDDDDEQSSSQEDGAGPEDQRDKSGLDQEDGAGPDHRDKSDLDQEDGAGLDHRDKSGPDQRDKSSLDQRDRSGLDQGDRSGLDQGDKSSLVQRDRSGLDRSGLDQGEPDPAEVKEEPEEVCISQTEEALVVKQEADVVMVTPPCEEIDEGELDPDSDLLLFLSSGPENQNPTGAEHEGPDVIEISDVPSGGGGERIPADGSSDLRRVSDPNRTFGKCEILGDVFRYEPGLNGRFLTRASEKPLICDVCGKRFSSLSTLKVHSKIHTGVGLLYCKICGRGFTRRDILRLHMRIHTGEKPYYCKTCGKSFRHSGTLTDHERTHTGEKPYTCHFCWKSFTYKRGLTVHMRTHSFISL